MHTYTPFHKTETVSFIYLLFKPDKPHITIKRDNDEVNNLTVVEGATVEIMCSGIGNPQPSISWYGTSKTSSEGNLTFTNTDRSQAGNYLCVATAISESYPSFSFSTNKSVSVIVFCTCAFSCFIRLKIILCFTRLFNNKRILSIF